MASGRTRVVVVADDLIWAERLLRILRAVGAEPTVVRSVEGLGQVLPTVSAAIVDLTARAYEGLAVVGEARAAGCRVLAVAQHDDVALQRGARAAGAERVVAYRLLHERGPEVLGAWLAAGSGSAAASGSTGPATTAGSR